jgi:hypothetical protein
MVATMMPRRPLPFQFGLGSLLAAIAWAAIVLAAWRSGLLQPTLMPILLPVAAAIGVLGVVLAARHFSH